MKYRYFYQTRENENRDGWISARNRAEAYAALRKQGIRPYRVVGNDPVRWQPWAILLAFVVLASAFVALVLLRGDAAREPIRRAQLVGDKAVIANGLLHGWADVFPNALDRHLAAYAQPGWIALPPEVTEADLSEYVRQLALPPVPVQDGDDNAVRQLKGIVATMRREMKEYIASGGTVGDYLAFLESRQDDEAEYRAQAEDSLRNTPEVLRTTARINLNMRLRELGLREITDGDSL